MSCWPKDVGISAIEVHFPSLYVDQTELETYDGASSGKYTIGLGQRRMGFCNDREDVHSLCLTVVQRLLDSYHIDPSQIGRLEVGTETILDKSKSVKSVLMQLFEPYGVTDLEGVDSTNACYGGTAALFNSIAWMESSAWNGKYALVVAADIAVYAKGAARPTGGAGAIAMLISPNAPLVFDRGVRATYVRHVYDFYKPDLTSEYPMVDGRLSVQCYLDALDTCYGSYCNNVKPKGTTTLDSFDFVLFHAPYCKLVQKSLARLLLNDFLRTPDELKPNRFPGSDKFTHVNLNDSYFDRDLEKAFMTYSSEHFSVKTKPSLLLATDVGNMYTPSLYAGLVSCLMCNDTSQLLGKKILLFSYGSGLASSMFSITVTDDFDLVDKITAKLGRAKRLLEQRERVSPKDFEATLDTREKAAHKAPYVPTGDVDTFFPGTYYLERVDEKYRRFYQRVPVAQNGHA